jgi:hypothetical protein
MPEAGTLLRNKGATGLRPQVRNIKRGRDIIVSSSFFCPPGYKIN